MPRVVPCLDVKDGRIVKGVRFGGLRDAGDPAERAELYERQGADEIVLLDVSATPAGRAHGIETVERVRARLGIPLTVGGGVRELVDAESLLGAGADKVSVNTAAVARPELVDELAARFGSQCTVVAIDAARTARGFGVLVRSGSEPTGRDAVEWAREACARGAGELLLTSFDRDGTGEGYDLELVRAVCEAVSVPVIASGGVRDAKDLAAGLAAGASAVLAASLFHDGRASVAEVKSELVRAGFEMRP